MHWSACDFCFWASPCAFTTRAATPAALNAFSRYGLSNCPHLTEVLVSGTGPRARMPALFLAVPVVPPVARATATAAASAVAPSAVDLQNSLFTYSLLLRGPGT